MPAHAKLVDRDMGWTATLKAVHDLARGANVKVGILGGDDGGGLHETDPATGKSAPLTVAEIAVVNEFGTEDGHVPARPFVRPTYDRMRDELAQDAGKLLVKVLLDRKMTVEDALDILGLKLATAIKQYVVGGSGVPPPNAPATIEAKGSDRPLVDTGVMLSKLSWSVVLGTVEKSRKFLTRRK